MLDKCPACEKHMTWIKKREPKGIVQCPLCYSLYKIDMRRLN